MNEREFNEENPLRSEIGSECLIIIIILYLLPSKVEGTLVGRVIISVQCGGGYVIIEKDYGGVCPQRRLNQRLSFLVARSVPPA